MLKSARLVVAIMLAIAPALIFAQQGAGTAQASKDRVALKQAEKAYVAAKKAYLSSPQKAPSKKKYVAATVSFGTTTMLSPLLPPKEKYPKALKLYREALKVDPKNKEALENKSMIEQIYKSMNRPIPKG